MSSKPTLKRAASRNLKILRIGQAHVAPGMSAERLNAILQQRGLNTRIADPWEGVPETTLDALIADIRAVLPPSPIRRGEGGEV